MLDAFFQSSQGLHLEQCARKQEQGGSHRLAGGGSCWLEEVAVVVAKVSSLGWFFV
jgi:hypothetical protein